MSEATTNSFLVHTGQSAEVLLAWYFQRNGYVRVVNEERRQQLGQMYKKGYEVRLVVNNEKELAHIRHLLEQIGFKAGKPFQKHCRIVQPVYGKRSVEWFSKWAGINAPE
ncbi:MAG TPA: hypothetical protein PLD25_08540 [Chloroflexota bacterium]|nr:hypothetical protein [Chloroflexota bacterium]HUM68392.1 hypothetical protein [Chloroflexota bacterium]